MVDVDRRLIERFLNHARLLHVRGRYAEALERLRERNVIEVVLLEAAELGPLLAQQAEDLVRLGQVPQRLEPFARLAGARLEQVAEVIARAREVELHLAEALARLGRALAQVGRGDALAQHLARLRHGALQRARHLHERGLAADGGRRYGTGARWRRARAESRRALALALRGNRLSLVARHVLPYREPRVFQALANRRPAAVATNGNNFVSKSRRTAVESHCLPRAPIERFPDEVFGLRRNVFEKLLGEV